MQTISLKKKRTKKQRFTRFLTAIAVAALILTGTVPSFADVEQKAGNNAADANSDLVESAAVNWEDAPAIDGTSAILIDAGSGDILYEKNAYERRDPASITKILNCLVVLETMDLDQEVTIPYQPEDLGHTMGLKKGEVLTIEQLVYAMMLYSANDAAEALAILTGGSVENFCEMMNERAEKCGAENTNYTNPNGLNTWGQDQHRTTAYDLAMISREAMKNATFRKIVSAKKYVIPATNKSKERVIRSTNLCLYSQIPAAFEGVKQTFQYEGMTGIKTGYTGTSGYCFCGSAKRGDTELIAVSLNSEEYGRYTDVMKLLDYGYSKYHTCVAAREKEPVGEAKVKRGAKSRVKLGIAEDMDITLNKSVETDSIVTEIDLNEKKVTAPVVKGEVLGTLTAYNEDGQPLARTEVFAAENIEKGGVLSYIGIADEHVPLFIITVILILAILIILRVLLRRRKWKKRRRQRAQIQRNARRKEWEREKNPFDRE